MNGRKVTTLLMTLGAGLLLSSATLLAQPGMGGGPGHRGPGGPGGAGGMGPLAALNLTDVQKDQVKALHEQFRKDHESDFKQMKTLHDQLRSQMQSGDKDGAKATCDQIKALDEKLHSDFDALHKQVESLLTDEQKAKLQEIIANRPGPREGKGKGMRGGPCQCGGGDGETGTQGTPGGTHSNLE